AHASLCRRLPAPPRTVVPPPPPHRRVLWRGGGPARVGLWACAALAELRAPLRGLRGGLAAPARVVAARRALHRLRAARAARHLGELGGGQAAERSPRDRRRPRGVGQPLLLLCRASRDPARPPRAAGRRARRARAPRLGGGALGALGPYLPRAVRDTASPHVRRRVLAEIHRLPREQGRAEPTRPGCAEPPAGGAGGPAGARPVFSLRPDVVRAGVDLVPVGRALRRPLSPARRVARPSWARGNPATAGTPVALARGRLPGFRAPRAQHDNRTPVPGLRPRVVRARGRGPPRPAARSLRTGDPGP